MFGLYIYIYDIKFNNRIGFSFAKVKAIFGSDGKWIYTIKDQCGENLYKCGGIIDGVFIVQLLSVL